MAKPTHQTEAASYSEDELERCHVAAFRVALSTGLRRPDAEDIAQHTTYIVMRNWARIDVPTAYASMVARRSSWYLKSTRDHEVDLEPSQDQSAGMGDPAAAAVAKVFVADVIASLPPRQAEVLKLHYLLDLPVDEVAERLGVSINTVKTHNRVALARLRENLEAN